MASFDQSDAISQFFVSLLETDSSMVGQSLKMTLIFIDLRIDTYINLSPLIFVKISRREIQTLMQIEP